MTDVDDPSVSYGYQQYNPDPNSWDTSFKALATENSQASHGWASSDSQSDFQTAEYDKFDHLHFAKFIATRSIEIMNIDEFEVDVKEDPRVRGIGGSMEVEFRRRNNELVALKFPAVRKRSYSDIMRDLFFEMQVMSHKPLCDHDNIVKLLGLTFDNTKQSTDNTTVPILVVEAADQRYPDLRRYIQSNRNSSPIPLDIVLHYAADIADGLAALHDFGVVHGDVNPANILLFHSNAPDAKCPSCDEIHGFGWLRAKVSDFGFSGIDVSHDPPRGDSILWAAPESKDLSVRITSPSRDIYSYGLVCGYLMMGGVGGPDLVRSGLYESQMEYRADATILINLLRSALQVEPTLRLDSLRNVRAMLFERFFLS